MATRQAFIMDFDGTILIEAENFTLISGFDSALRVLESDMEIAISSETGSALDTKLQQYLGPVPVRIGIEPLPAAFVETAPTIVEVTAGINFVTIEYREGSRLGGLWQIDYRVAGATAWTTATDRESADTYTIANLAQNTRYEFRVRRGLSPFSPFRTGTTSAPPAAAPEITYLRSARFGSTIGSITIHAEGGMAGGSWIIEYRESGTGEWETHTDDSTLSPITITIPNLEADQEYDLQARRSNSQIFSNTLEAIEARESMPRPIAGPTASLRTNNAGIVRIEWTPVTGATGYQIYETQSVTPPTSMITPMRRVGSSTTNLFITDLTRGQTYRIYVRATLATGFSQWSNAVVLTVA